MGIQIKGSNDTISAADGSIVLEGATLTFTNENITGISTMASAEVTGGLRIGTNSVTANVAGDDLKIEGASDRGLSIISGSSSSGNIYFGDSSDADIGRVMYNHNDNALQVYTNATAAPNVTIDSGGRVGIGTVPLASEGAELNIRSSDGATNVGLIPNTNSQSSQLTFYNATNDSAQGYIKYDNSDNSLQLRVNLAERLRIDSSGRLLVGSTSSRSAGDVGAQLQVEGTTYHTSSLALIANAGASAGNNSHLTLAKSRGSSDGSDTILVDGDSIGIVQWAASDGTDLNCVAAEIRAKVDGTPGANDMPGLLQFGTTADGAAAPTTRLTIASTGFIGAGTVNPRRHLHIHNSASATVGFQMTNGATGESNDSQGFQLKVASDLHAEVAQMENSYLSFYTNATEKLRIDTTGRLLIGGTSSLNQYGSQSHLQVQGTEFDDSTIALRRDQNNANPPGVIFAKSRHGSLGGSTIVQEGDQIGAMIFAAADGTDLTSVTAVINVEIDGTPGSNDVPGRIVFETTADGASSPTERLRIDSTGRLLANTTNTNDVTAGGMKIQSAATDGVATILNLRNPQLTGGNAATRIGFNMDRTGGGIHFQAGAITVHKQQEWTSTPGTVDSYMTFSTILSESMTEKMRIQSDGGISFGATGAVNAEKFTFQGTNGQLMYIDHSGTDDHSVVQIRHRGAAGSTYRTQISFLDDNADQVGSIKSHASATQYNTASDYRLKENEVSITDGITRLKTLKPYRFNFKKDPSTTVDGFFAHEVTAVPEAVAGTKDGTEMQGMDYGRITPLLTAALQEAITKIETLETKVAALESS